MLHLALDAGNNQYQKKLRNSQATISGNLPATRIVPISEKDKMIQRNIGNSEFNSGHFALEMIESAEKVSFY